MKTTAAVLYEIGKPTPYGQSTPLSIETVDLEGPQQGEVLIEVGAAGLCHSDLSVINGARPRDVPIVMGHEGSGIVREVGAGVTDFRDGDHVVFSFVPVCGECPQCLRGRATLCEKGAAANAQGRLITGAKRFRTSKNTVCNHHLGVSAFSRFTVVAQESLVRIEHDIPLDIAALFGCAAMTGVGAVLNTADLRPGQSAAIFGLGGVGLAALLGAKVANASAIIAIDVIDAKLELATSLGATHTINAANCDAVAAVRDISGGGVDFSFESVGSETVLIQAYEATARGGTTIAIGLPHPDKKFTIPAVSLVAEERIVRGSYMGSCLPRRDIPRYLSLYKQGKLPLDKLVSDRIRINDINAAFDRLDSGEAVRQVITYVD